MRSCFIAPFLSVSVFGTAFADTLDYSKLIAEEGLSGAKTTLQAVSAPTPSDQFALGGVNFLSAIEHALQTRYSFRIDPEMLQMANIPILRLPVPENPDADPFSSTVVADIFENVLADMEQALEPLDRISDGDAVAVKINPADIWFDINGNGTRENSEGLYAVAGALMGLPIDGTAQAEPPALTVNFDTSDAAWLSAYAHLLSGISETILSLDPTTAIERVTFASRSLDELAGSRPRGYFTGDDARFVDLFAIFAHAIEGQPDADRTGRALEHFSGMIADNTTFWTRVGSETDNDMEWIPNANQTSALPIPFPPETETLWRGVLADAKAILNGELLIPHWRLGSDAGIDFKQLMENPPEIDIVAVIQGETILPFSRKGPVATSASMRAFEQLLGGEAALYALILN